MSSNDAFQHRDEPAGPGGAHWAPKTVDTRASSDTFCPPCHTWDEIAAIMTADPRVEGTMSKQGVQLVADHAIVKLRMWLRHDPYVREAWFGGDSAPPEHPRQARLDKHIPAAWRYYDQLERLTDGFTTDEVLDAVCARYDITREQLVEVGVKDCVLHRYQAAKILRELTGLTWRDVHRVLGFSDGTGGHKKIRRWWLKQNEAKREEWIEDTRNWIHSARRLRTTDND